MHRIVTGDVVRPTRLIPGYPQALEAIVMKALAVDPAQRYQSAGLLLEAIENFAIASRMAMSTMALGRFMRDMFGDVPEPWLTPAGRQSQPIVARESTISSTDAKSGPIRTPGPDTLPPMTLPPEQLSADAVPDEDGSFPDSGSLLARTVLDLPRGQSQAEPHEDQRAEWDAKSYPSQQPSLVPSPLQEVYPQALPLPLPAPMPQGTQPLPPPTAFTANPGSASNSSPAYPGVDGQQIPSTRHGYASAVPTRGDISYPRYEPPRDALAPDVQLRPSRRPLIIVGIALALIAIGIVIVMAMSGSRDSSSEPAADPGSDETQMTTQPNEPKPVPQAAPVVADDMVSIHIVSDPKGADVLIANTKIGVTPLDTKLKRGTKVTQLTVHMDGYQDVTTKIDLGGDYSNEHIKLLKIDEQPATPEPEVAPPAPEKTPEKTPDKTIDKAPDKTIDKKIVHNPVHTPPVHTAPPHHDVQPAHHEAPATTPKCQPPGPNVDPFSSIPVCSK
jgi:hypothetical protein